MKKYSLRPGGFTLIELMIVMVIVVTLSGASITSYLNFNKNQAINNDVRNFTSEVYRVRTLASTMQYPENCTSLKSYTLKSDTDMIGVISSANCTPTLDNANTTKILVTSVFESAFNITFLPGSGYLANGIDQIITIKNPTDPTLTKTITIGAFGTVISN